MNVKYMYKTTCIIHVKSVSYMWTFEKYSYMIGTVNYYCKHPAYSTLPYTTDIT